MGERWVIAALAGVLAAGVAAAAYNVAALIVIGGSVAAFIAAFVWHNRTEVAVTPNVLLVALPTVLAAPTHINTWASVGLLAGFAALAFAINKRHGLQLGRPAAILPLIGLAIVWRPNFPAALPGVVFFTIGLVVVARAVYMSKDRASAVVSLFDGVGVFLVASVVMHFAGMGWLDGDKRVIFPLANSQAATPALAAVYLAAAAPVIITHKHRLPRLTGAAAAIYVVLTADRRTALFGALIIGVCVLLLPHVFRRIAPVIVGVAVLAPLIYPHFRNLVGQTVAGMPLMRPGEKPDSLNGRDFIWSRALFYYQHQLDWRHQAFGYGSNGHRASGVSRYYSNMFGSNYGNRNLLTTHNSLLQFLFDGGWVAALAFAAVMIWLAVRLRRDSAGLAMVTALAVIGATEVELSAGQTAWWVLVTLSVVAFSRDSAKTALSSEFSAESRAIV